MGALGFSFNTELLKKKGVAPPGCWADLLQPTLKGEIQMANPASSGTAYTAVATVVQLMGEAKAFEYLKSLHANVNQYTKSHRLRLQEVRLLGGAPASARQVGPGGQRPAALTSRSRVMLKT